MMKRHGAPDAMELVGLCSGCDKEAVCTYPKAPRRPVLSCLEFEETELPGRNGQSHPAGALRVSIDGGAAPSREPGLCSTCDLNGICVFPRKPGGVWFCEEYR